MMWPGEETSLAADGPDAGTISRVELLGHDGPLDFTRDAEGLKIKLPSEPPCEHAFALKITGLKLAH